MAIAIIGRMRIGAADWPDFEPALIEHLAGTYAEEPGCLALNVHRAAKDKELLLAFELFRDPEALAAHKATDRLARFRARTEAMMRDGRIAYAETANIAPAPRMVAAPDGPIAIFVACRVEQRDRFDAAMDAHAAGTRAEEPGCLAFEWSRTPQRPDQVQLYELYAGREALAAHRASERLRAFRAETGPLMLEAQIHYAELAWHAPLGRLLERHGAVGAARPACGPG